MKKYVLITGASTGLGKAFAYEFAQRGYNTLLVSLPGENLKDVCEYCRSRNTESEYFELNLCDKDSLIALTKEVNEKYDVSILVNNAGLGGSRCFEKASLNYISTMIQLNVAATTLMTHELLPNLKRNTPSEILNISSMAALIPSGFKTVYPASKSFIKYFSLGLREELRNTGVSVSLAILGPMPTKKEISDRIDKQGFLGKMLKIMPDRVAKTCIDGALKRKRIIVVGRMNNLSYFLQKCVPEWLKTRLMSVQVAKNEI